MWQRQKEEPPQTQKQAVVCQGVTLALCGETVCMCVCVCVCVCERALESRSINGAFISAMDAL